LSWVLACRLSEVPPGRGWPARVGDRRVAVFRSKRRVYALENSCAHLGNPIDDGAVSGHCVTCPWHGWRYDLRSGEVLGSAGRRPGLRTYPVKVDGDQVLIDLGPDTPS